jgi:glyoxylase-like metal-dependent hydrolase (beta-lactamase superfamily II)
MEYRQFILGELQTNCYLLWSGTEAGIIDPGGSVDEVIRFIDQQGLQLKWIVNTHGHADHIIGNRPLQKQYDVPIFIHPADREMLTSSTANLSAFIGAPMTSPDAKATIKNGDTLALGEERLQVLETPGHTQGGISLYIPGRIFAGDTLFYESIGRTDLPGGNHWQLLNAIRDRLLVLPPETVVLPGHGPASTIAHEIEWNPFIQEENELSY